MASGKPQAPRARAGHHICAGGGSSRPGKNALKLATNLESAAFFFPDHPAISENGIEITCAELNDRASLVASGLADMGVNPGDNLALCA